MPKKKKKTKSKRKASRKRRKKIKRRLPKKRNILVCAGVGHFLVEIIAKRLNMSCINFHELLDCDINSQHNSNICTAAVAIAHLDRLTKIK